MSARVLEQGNESMKPVHFVDTTIRDGNMSLWASGMRTDMILPIVAQIDRAGFQAHEVIAGALFKKMIRELHDDPWERLRLIAKRAPRTPMRAIMGRSVTAFEFTPRSIANLFLERLVANGIREVRISDCSNTASVWVQQIADCRCLGLKTILNLIFSISPVHTDEYYTRLTRAATSLGVDRLCIKDPGGLLKPDRTRDLTRAILAEAKGIPIEFHTHCNTGMGPLCVLEALDAGLEIINTATPPLANGSSNPSIFNIAENAIALGYTPSIDLDALRPVCDHFSKVASRESLPIGRPLEYTEAHYTHQVPGGMISNLRHQLSQMKMLSRLPEVLEEIARVRKDFGYPIMVTPYSQFVGAQAVMNVIMGERYKQVSDQVTQYALGFWGKAEAEAMDPNLRDRICSAPRARELACWRVPDPSLEEVRRQLGGAGVDDDELMLRYFAGADAVTTMRAAPPRSEFEIDGRVPIVALIKGMMKTPNVAKININTGDLALHLVGSRSERSNAIEGA